MVITATQPKREYQDENGTYQLPKDSPEHDRLDGQSASLIALMKYRPFHAPISQPKRILDVGCGTAGMTNLLASIYPEAQVIGIDIAPVPESRHGKQPNADYVQGDIRELLGKDSRFELGSFDYIFHRLLVFGMTEWSKHIASVSKLLRPSGWLEIQEASVQLYSKEGHRRLEGERWFDEFISQSAALGLDIEIGDKLKELFDVTPGLTNVRESVYGFTPVERIEAPELAGLEGQILGLFTVVMRKIMSARGWDEAFVEPIAREMKQRWDRGFEESDRHRMYAVVGQKK